jgi:hypothetical protein
MAGFRELVGQRVLKKKQKNLNRETRVHNFDTAKSVVILFDALKKDAFKIIWEFRRFLKDKGISCTLYGYVNQKETPPDMLIRKGLYIINKGNLNWFLQPKGESAELFKKETPDILIDFNTDYRIEIQFLVLLSPASFKIGCFTEENNDYDLMIKLSGQEDMSYLLEQITHYVSILNPVN